MKKYIVPIIIILVIVAIVYYFTKGSSKPSEAPTDLTPVSTTNNTPATTTQTKKNLPEESIGTSVGGNSITAYHFGTGSTEILFVGGIHGGYEWNTALVAYQFMDYLKQNPSIVPSNVRVTVIPVLNPDGLSKVVGTAGSFTKADVSTSQTTQVAGRFNGNNVDLNRNFDCDWQSKGVWQNKTVSGGTSAFSEPESAAMKSYVETNKPAAVVVWYSAAGGVFASNCHSGVSADTESLMKAFATASGYPAHGSFDFYATTGDMTNWLAKINIPAISVILTNHTDTEWTKNLAGIKAVLKAYTK
jgi:hypothetical protein